MEPPRHFPVPHVPGPARVFLFIAAVLSVVGLAALFGVARDYGYVRATLLTASSSGNYHALGERLAARASRAHGTLTVVATEGSVDNVARLSSGARCTPAFAFIQDGTPVPAGAKLEVLGRLPQSEVLLLLAKRDRRFASFSDLRGVSVGIGPEGSGTAYLMRQLFEDQDLRDLGTRLSPHEWSEQLQMVAEGRLDLAAIVISEDAQLVHQAVRQYDLDIVSPQGLEGLVKRHPWLELGRIPTGRYNLERPTPSADRLVAEVETLVIANACAKRAERIALLALLSEEFTGFVRANPPKSIESGSALPLAPEARQFFVTGEPEIADRYFPWLVNLMSPVYWVYLAMAATILFNAMRGFSRFRLWRIDSAREKLKARIAALASPMFQAKPGAVHPPEAARSEPEASAAAAEILEELAELRRRCQRYVASVVTPMGDEMFYRYQELLINELTAALTAAAPSDEPPARNIADTRT